MSLTNTNEYYVTNRGYKIAKRICRDIKDNFSRKRAFAALICMDTLADYLYSQGYNIDISKNLYKILPINEEFEFTDIHCNGYFIDVIPVVNERFMLIPKSHFEKGIAPDLYVAASYSPITKKVKFAGCISSQDIDKSKQNEYYYIVRTDLLSAPDLVEETISMPREVSVSEDNHEAFDELFISYLDGTIEDSDKKHLLKHLIECKKCRDKFVDFFDYEMIAVHTKQYPEVLADHTLGIVGATEANDERYKNFEEITLEIDKEPDEYAEDEEEQTTSHKTIKPAIEDPLQILYGNKNNEMFDMIADKPIKKVSILTDIINDVQAEKAKSTSKQDISPKTGSINPEYYAEGLSEGIIEQKEETPQFIDFDDNQEKQNDNTLSLEESGSDDLLLIDDNDTPLTLEDNDSNAVNNSVLDKPVFLEEQEKQEENTTDILTSSEIEDRPLFAEEDDNSFDIISDQDETNEIELQNEDKDSANEDLLLVDNDEQPKEDEISLAADDENAKADILQDDDMLVIDDEDEKADILQKDNDDNISVVEDILTTNENAVREVSDSDTAELIESPIKDEDAFVPTEEENDIDDLVQFDVEDVDLTDENDNEYETADDGTRSKVPNNLEEAGVVASSLLDYEDKNKEEFISAAKDRLNILQSEDNADDNMLIIDDNDNLSADIKSDDDMLIIDDNNSQEQAQNSDDMWIEEDGFGYPIDEKNDILQKDNNDDMLVINDEDEKDDVLQKDNNDDMLVIDDEDEKDDVLQKDNDDDMLVIDDEDEKDDVLQKDNNDDMLVIDDEDENSSMDIKSDNNDETVLKDKEKNISEKTEKAEQNDDLTLDGDLLPSLEDDFDFGELEDFSEDNSNDLTLEEPKEEPKAEPQAEEKDYFPEIQTHKDEEDEKDDIVLIDDDLNEKVSLEDDFSFDDNSFIRPAGASMPEPSDNNFVRPASVPMSNDENEDDDLVIIDDEEENKDVTDFVRPASMWDFPDDNNEPAAAQTTPQNNVSDITSNSDKQEDTEDENDDFNPADFEFKDDTENPSEEEPQKAPSQLDIVLAGINKEKEKNPIDEEPIQNTSAPSEYNPNKNIFRQFKDAITAKEEAIEAGKFDDLEEPEEIEEPLINTTQTAEDEDDDLSYIDDEDVENLQPQFYSKDFSDVETFDSKEEEPVIETLDEQEKTTEKTYDDNEDEEEEEYEEYEEEIIDDSSENEEEEETLDSDEQDSEEDSEEEENTDSSQDEEADKKKKKLIAIIAASAVLAAAIIAGGGLAAKKFIFDKNQNAQTTETNDILGGDTQTAEDDGEAGGLLLPGDDNKPQPINEETGGLLIPDDNSEGALGASMPAQTTSTTPTETAPQQPAATPQTKEPSGLEAQAPQNVPTASTSGNDLSASKISWGVGASLAGSPDFKSYLQTTGKVIKANLNKDLRALKVAKPTGTTKLMFVLDETGKIESTATIKSCGSKQVDDFVLQSITQSIQTCSFPILPQDVLKANEQAVKSRNIKLSLTVTY